ncbi:MAG: hypothetical protein H0U12_03390 [Thermoleophilaceae bacterium]|jgi:hypothetical protein|nr:hypothetical protein [Thermoleophilaceae bacterium]
MAIPETRSFDLAATEGEDTAIIALARSAASGERRLLPVFIPNDERFFWSPEWQAGERDFAADRDEGKLRRFSSGRELIDWLKSDDPD